MRKLLLSLACLLFMTGLVIAGEAVFVKFDADKKELTVKEDDKENTYKLTDKTKLTLIDKKDGSIKEGNLNILAKAKEGKTKLDITTDKDTITEIKMKIGKKSQ